MGKKKRKRKAIDIKTVFRCKNLYVCVNRPKLSKRKIRQDSLANQKRDYLGLAKKFRVPISYAIEQMEKILNKKPAPGSNRGWHEAKNNGRR